MLCIVKNKTMRGFPVTKLILIEGIPGSGKTTIAQKISERYLNKGVPVNLYLEGPGHPVDLGWHACFPIQEYESTLKQYGAYRDEIERNAIFDGEYVLIPFTKVQDNGHLLSLWEDYDVYGGHKRVSDKVACRLTCNRMKAFAVREKDSDAINIFEAAVFQGNINKLMMWENADTDKIIVQMNELCN